mgnify:CR=1 FL=1
MKILLDTHILVWFFSGDEQLSQKARDMIADEDNEIYYSILSAWEVEIKHTSRPDKLSLSCENFISYCEELKFIPLPIEIKHILQIGNLNRKEKTPPHRDPFDRAMLCQAMSENMIFMTHDERIAEYVTTCVYKV